MILRVSLLKETDELIRRQVAELLGEALSLPSERASVHVIDSPTSEQSDHMHRVCQMAGDAVYRATGKAPALEIALYSDDGVARVIWRYLPPSIACAT